MTLDLPVFRMRLFAARQRTVRLAVHCLVLVMLFGQPLISAAAMNAPQPCCVVETSCRDQDSPEPAYPCKKSCSVCLRGDCCQVLHYLVPESRMILRPAGLVEDVDDSPRIAAGRTDRPLLPPPKRQR